MINVIKRSGEKEPLNIEKIQRIVDFSSEGIVGVSSSLIQMNARIQFYDDIKTSDIQELLIRSAKDLITLEETNYQFAAAKLLLYDIYKRVYGDYSKIDYRKRIKQNVELNLYDKLILDSYSEKELDEITEHINISRDNIFTYASVQTIHDKYLVKNKNTKEIFECPQLMYMMIALSSYYNDKSQNRISNIKKLYDGLSKHYINAPTPILAGLRKPNSQLSSCVLIRVDDNLDSILTTNTALGLYTANRAGIGLCTSKIRANKSNIGNGEKESTGKIPFLKMYARTTKSMSQAGVRTGSSTVFENLWHYDVEDFIVLKNTKGTVNNRERDLDYAFCINDVLYERILKNEKITLFCPNELPDLYESFYEKDTNNFRRLYNKYEEDETIKKKKTVDALELMISLIYERAETGRIYILNIDHANSHSSFKEKIYQSNLCMEVLQPNKPLYHIDDYENSEISLCTLSALNVGKVNNDSDIFKYNKEIVRYLDNIIDLQDYPVKAAEHAIHRRNLGIGITGLAHYVAKNKLDYGSDVYYKKIHNLAEAHQYSLLKASIELAKEKGPCTYFDKTVYSDGILPIDTYKKTVDTIAEFEYKYDWEELRAEILKYGLRHSTLSAFMPVESSSLSNNSPNGINNPRDFLVYKGSKEKPVPVVVPSYKTLKNHYKLMWDGKNNRTHINTMAIFTKFIDQSISTDLSYNLNEYENSKISMEEVLTDILYSYKMGLKTLYYHNTNTNITNSIMINSEEDDCESCKL